MPWFALETVQTEYELTSGNRLTIYRHSLRADIGGASWVSPRCLVDTGAPFSVVSHAVAQSIGAALRPLPVRRGSILTYENGALVAPTSPQQLLGWYDPVSHQLIPCVLAEMTVRLRNRLNGDTSDPLSLIAKVLQAPALPFNGRFVLLGTHLLTANGGQLHIEGQTWGLGGPGLFFPP